ncbi:hypothetical protein EW145_g4450 [Phellinidium pouzarii]|uniref:Mid2 domain-containing protein n=1 Tax=Phellinidium pouzarii TaxID=167371 RepID=A0A4S4L3L5_9AGAM|nr:hypothetical protein EW145_g4450 [Phellinidium pouzarii]
MGNLKHQVLRAIATVATVALLSASASAQTSISETFIPESATTTSPPDPLATPVGTQTAACWETTVIDSAPASFALNPSEAATVNGAVCDLVYSLNGGIAMVPTTIEVSPSSQSISGSAASSSPVAASTSSTSSNRAIKVIMPALIGSLVGALLLCLATIYFLRLRTRRKAEASRTRRWAERKSGSWAMNETSQRPGANDAATPFPLAYAYTTGCA